MIFEGRTRNIFREPNAELFMPEGVYEAFTLGEDSMHAELEVIYGGRRYHVTPNRLTPVLGSPGFGRPIVKAVRRTSWQPRPGSMVSQAGDDLGFTSTAHVYGGCACDVAKLVGPRRDFRGAFEVPMSFTEFETTTHLHDAPVIVIPSMGRRFVRVVGWGSSATEIGIYGAERGAVGSTSYLSEGEWTDPSLLAISEGRVQLLATVATPAAVWEYVLQDEPFDVLIVELGDGTDAGGPILVEVHAYGESCHR